MPGKCVGAQLSDAKFFKISHFVAFFDVISAPVARHGWRLWQMKAGAWSFYLPKSWLRDGGCFLVMLGYFSVFFWPRLGSLVLAHASFSLELRFARVSAQEEPLVRRFD